VEAGDEPSATGEWLGAPMYFSHFDEDTMIGLVQAAGFAILETAVEEQREGDHSVPYLGCSQADSVSRRQRYGGARSSSTDPSGRRNTGCPSTNSRVKPRGRWISWWCRRQRSSRFEAAVGPPSAQ
jgi:hypothetical protein